MLYHLQAVKDNIRNREGKRVFYLSDKDRLTNEARDYLCHNRIEILSAKQARPERYRLLGGGYLEEKPESMTHLSGDILVSKTHPRIAFRGAMDTLEAELLLCQLHAPGWEQELGQILTLARRILACEVLEEPCEEQTLCGLTQGEIRSHSHRPQDFYDQPHFMPQASDGETILHLNRARCAAREAELMAVKAIDQRTDILKALNRMSSMLYILMIREKAKTR